MIVKMERLSAFGMLRDKDIILNRLIREKCIEFIDPKETLGELALSASVGIPETSAYRDRLERYETALKDMGPYIKKKGLFYNRPILTYDQLESAGAGEAAEEQCRQAEALIGELNECVLAREKTIGFRESLIPWLSSSLPLEIKSTDSLNIDRYVLPPDTKKAELLLALETNAAASHIEYVLEEKLSKYAILISHKENSDTARGIMERFNAKPVYISDMADGPAKKNLEAADAGILEYSGKIGEITGKLNELGADLSALRYGCDAMALKICQEEAVGRLILTKTVFCFNGWVPVDKKTVIQKILDEFLCEYKFEAALQGEKDEPPILFKNNLLGQSSEAVVRMYALPNYYSSDPNYVVAPFFSLFFGMMLSDAAYGLILLLGGLLVLKKMDISDNMKGLVKTLMFGGGSAVFWGFFYGSWFGDIATVVAKTFFNADFVIPAFVNPLHDPVTVMVISLSFGLLHIFAGMGVKAYLMIIRGHVWGAVFDVGLWYVFIIGIGLCFLGGDILLIGMITAVAGALGLILTQGREQKGIIKKFFGGIASLYKTIGYFSDLLSYSRVLALGLSTAVIASVFNTMGSMAGGNILGALVLLVVFIIGHVFNILISSFGSYVHTARLHYVEFFGKFYESGGRPFQPYQIVPKYCQFSEGDQ